MKLKLYNSSYFATVKKNDGKRGRIIMFDAFSAGKRTKEMPGVI